MTKAFRKNILRTIQRSIGRYLAIFAIIALGVGFFSGIKASRPDMIKTAQVYIDEMHLYDFQLISTWGFTQDEVEKISKLNRVEAAEGAVAFDFLYKGANEEEDVLRAYSITKDVNELTLAAGELPRSGNECVLDDAYYTTDMIGQEIKVSAENSDDTKNSFAYPSYKVTGLVRSPVYMNRERGTTTVGNGQVHAYVYMLLEAFQYDYFNMVYVYGKEDAAAFTDAYDKQIKKAADPLEKETTTLIEERYKKEIKAARDKINDAQKELDEKTKAAQADLDDARKQIDEGQEALAEGIQQIADSWQTLSEKQAELQAGQADLQAGINQYNAGLQQYQEGVTQYNAGVQQYQEAGVQYQSQKAQYDQQQAAYAAMISAGGARVPDAEVLLEQTRQQLEAANTVLAQTEFQLAVTAASLSQARAELDASFARLEAARVQLADGQAQLLQGQSEIQNAEAEIAEKSQELESAKQRYEDGIATLEQEIKKGQDQISEAEEELQDIEAPKIYLADRNTNVGYAYFESDIGIVESVAKVFPIFFFLIAALVCSTTMTRMVDDEHSQIGTFRAVGYGTGSILAKYIIYAASAAALGSLTGFFIGIRIFPQTIWMAYSMLYGFSSLVYETDYMMLLLCFMVAFICSAGTAFLACRIELTHAPADMIRPKAPPEGKRIWLERVPFIWKRMKFLYKVSARNIFRFKKRMFMMIVGIAGCMALVLGGMGLRDSISDVVNVQYGEILRYDINAAYTKEIKPSMLADFQQHYNQEIDQMSVLMQTGADAPMEKGSKSVTLLIDQKDELQNCVNLHLDGKDVKSPGKGEIVIDERLAKAGGWKTGDEINLQSGDILSKPLKISGIFENYILYYAYMTADTYEYAFGEDYTANTILVSVRPGADEYKIASWLNRQKNAARVQVVDKLKSQVGNMMNSLNYVVLLVIGSAGVLAFIVLFNLGNINISERVREIATLKVLGFYPGEMASYVFRENFVLCLIGMAAGIPLGIVLHRFVISQLKIDMISFEVIIEPQSYAISLLTVLGFSVIVDVILRKKLEKINMAESLKSVE